MEKTWKSARPYYGRYRVVNVTLTNVEAKLIGYPDAKTIQSRLILHGEDNETDDAEQFHDQQLTEQTRVNIHNHRLFAGPRYPR